MRVFVTGATGFIGTAVVRELLDAGHEVLGLARSDRAEAALAAAGARAHRGDLDDLDSLRAGAAASDGVVHTAFDHGLDDRTAGEGVIDGAGIDFAGAAAKDRRAVEALGEALAGSGKPLVITGGTSGLAAGRLATEDSVPEPDSLAGLRFAVEEAAMRFAGRGVRVSAVRLPPTVHDEGDHGFVPMLIAVARARGVSAYPGDGANRWPAVHRPDAAHLYRLAVERAPAGSRLHGVGEEGVPVRDIAEAIGRHLDLPVTAVPHEEAADHFGFLGPIFSMDVPASSEATRRRLDWHPAGLGLIADLDKGHYFS
ncbi:SDR family oxidoreductase [Actinomadura fibrosa]|uniref:SDR family oxidoreductase n=1 Tax=Actinomadura fibrosa TaxID=111802 RepID=A0ABW2XBW6_9ACTN|nr:SDR family oxidoreductase [Actinomadura fibrosa]